MALQLAIDKAGSKAELSRKIDLEAMSIWRVLKGETRWIRDDTWQKLAPAIREFLPAAFGSAALCDVPGVAYDAHPPDTEERQVLDMLRALPPAEREKFLDQLKNGYIRATLASAKTG